MKPATPRQRALVRALRALIPRASYLDFDTIAEACKARHLRELKPADAVFLTTVAHIRHKLTDYDALLAEGYDQDSARYFVADDIDRILREWGAFRGLASAPEAEAGPDQPG